MPEPDSVVVSSDTTKRDSTQDGIGGRMAAEHSLQTSDPAFLEAMGNVPALSPAGEAAPADPHAYTREIAKRIQSEGRWKGQAEFARDDLMRSSKGKFPDDRSRQAWVYGELDRMYPPLEVPIRIGNSVDAGQATEDGKGEIPIRIGNSGGPDSDTYRKLGDDSGSIQGLAEIPEGWPELPANASLAAELGWVQANRLRIVEERPGRATRVSLGQALSPAPSWAALGWLETSIRSYAKFVDVAAKVSGGEDDEGAVMRAERRSVDEVRALLREMQAAEGACSRCGRPY